MGGGIKWNDNYSGFRYNLPLLIILLVCVAIMVGIVGWFLGEAY